MKLFLSILPILASFLVATRAYGTEGPPGENPGLRPHSRRMHSSTTTSPSPHHSSSAAPAVYTNTCGPPCDDLCTCDSHGHMNCHSNPWFCYDTCCRKE
ncbi:hypothetical protein F4809DRAFT_639836 [Biscogniauxia mediterranea]|nr:hypothetical protein F4809DRAFT_639836 [Biscogniauxia mediterranea]